MLKYPVIFLIQGYQYLISPLLGNRCRFYPSCSSYALEAIQVHGAFKGCCLSLLRLSKCHPFHEGGIDLVPSCCSHPHELEEK